MATKKIIQQKAFTAGQLSPLVRFRTDGDEYERGLKQATNAIVELQGPVSKRNGSVFVARCKFNDPLVRFIKYQVTNTTYYILELGNKYIRFYSNNQQVVGPNVAITGITNAALGVVTSTSHGLSTGDYIYITEVGGMTQINSSVDNYMVNVIDANTFTLQNSLGTPVNTTSYGTYTSSTGIFNKITEIPTVYTSNQLAGIDFAQTDDILYLTHPQVFPNQLQLLSNGEWSFGPSPISPVPSYEAGNMPVATLTPGATTGNGITFTASATSFYPSDVGRELINLIPLQLGTASITAYTDATHVVADILVDFPSTSAIPSQSWKKDLSPICALTPDGTQEGAIVNVYAYNTIGSVGPALPITAITNANPCEVSFTGPSGFAGGETIRIDGVVGMTQLNGRLFQVTVINSNTVYLNGENSTNYNTYISGGLVREVLTNIALNDVFHNEDIGKYILLNGGVLQILGITSTSPSIISTSCLSSLDEDTSSNVWSLEVPTWTGEFESENLPIGNLTPGAITGTNILFRDSASEFVPGNIGQTITNLSGTGVAIITGYISTSIILATITTAFPSTSTINAPNWSLTGSGTVTQLVPSVGLEPTSIGTLTSQANQNIQYDYYGITVTGATNANPCVLTVTGHQFKTGDVVQFNSGYSTVGGGSGGGPGPNLILFAPTSSILMYTNYTITVVDANHISLNGTNTTADGSFINAYTQRVYLTPIHNLIISDIFDDNTMYSGGPTAVVSVYSPGHGLSTGDIVYLAPDIFTSDWSASMLALANTPLTITVPFSDRFYLNGITYDPFLGHNSIGGIIYQPPSIAQNALISYFNSTNVNEELSIDGGTIQITGYTDSSHVNIKVLTALLNTNTTSVFSFLPVWNSGRGYPNAVGFYSDRIWYGGSNAQPDTIWGSQLSNFSNFGAGADNGTSIEETLLDNTSQVITWMSIGRNMLIGTSSGEYSIESSDGSGLTPSNILAKLQTSIGGYIQQPIRIIQEVLFVENSHQRMRSLIYNYFKDNYDVEDITFLATDLSSQKIIKYDYAPHDNQQIVGVTQTGQLLICCYDAVKRIVAWTPQITAGTYLDVCSVINGYYSQIWTLVQRTLNTPNGLQTVQCVEYFDNGVAGINTSVFGLDCVQLYSQPIAIAAFTYSNPAIIATSLPHGLSTGDSIVLKGITDASFDQIDSSDLLLSSLNQTIYTITVLDSTHISLDGLDLTDYNPVGTTLGNIYKRISTVSNLTNLEGKTVSVLGDGLVLEASGKVTNGSITLNYPAGEIIVGLPYTMIVETLEPEYDIGLGSMRGQQVKWDRPLLYLYNSSLPYLNGNYLPARNGLSLMDQRTNLYTGYAIYGQGTANDSGTLLITSTDPLPVTIIGLTGTIQSGVI